MTDKKMDVIISKRLVSNTEIKIHYSVKTMEEYERLILNYGKNNIQIIKDTLSEETKND
jgi:hypothetical protein